MKYFNILAILLLSSSLTFYSCNENKESSKTDVPGIDDSKIEAPQTVAVDTLNATTTPAQPNTTTLAEPAQNAAGVWHFTCPKGCTGGAGAAGNCATCGGALAHNQAYHGQTNSMPAMNPMTIQAPTTPATATPQQPEPAQNAAGVWHYTCAKGCAGGAGAPGNCATCGGALAHNQTYHK
jgi:hypothetical protein